MAVLVSMARVEQQREASSGGIGEQSSSWHGRVAVEAEQ